MVFVAQTQTPEMWDVSMIFLSATLLALIISLFSLFKLIKLNEKNKRC